MRSFGNFDGNVTGNDHRYDFITLIVIISQRRIDGVNARAKRYELKPDCKVSKRTPRKCLLSSLRRS